MEQYLTEPFNKEKLKTFTIGDTVLITGTIYTARDEAHKRLVEMLARGEALPFEIQDAIVYYVGPTPEKPGNPIGSAGPTTSYRMDPYAATLLALGQAGMIGKGPRSQEVKDAIVRNKAVYFGAIGGAAALMAKSVQKAEIIAFPELGAEAIRKLTVINFPVTVVMDSQGNDLYEAGPAEYLKTLK